MRKVLFISGEYSPVSNGTVRCVENILNALLTDGVEITLYAGYRSRGININSIPPNVTIKTPPKNIIDTLHCWRSELILKNSNTSKAKKMLLNVFRVLTYPVLIANKYFGYSTSDGWIRNLPKLIFLNENMSSYDAIMSVAAPFSNITVSNELKVRFNFLKQIVFEFDLYTDNIESRLNEKMNSVPRNNRLQKELMWYKNADLIVVTEEMYDTIANSELFDFKRKIIPLKMPMLAVDHEYDCSDNDLINRDEIIIVYTGRFYKDIRNPDFSLKLVEKLVEIDPRVVLHIYGFGCEDIIDQFKKRIGDNLIFHGNRGKQEVLNAINNADILLNISNKTTTQAPSKIIEYVSSRKPIINIYSVDNDRCVRILDKYQLSISIKEDRSMLEDYVDQLRSFITCNIGKKMSKNEIVREYSEYSAEYFVNKMMEKLKDK